MVSKITVILLLVLVVSETNAWWSRRRSSRRSRARRPSGGRGIGRLLTDNICARNCWRNNWKERDSKATAAGLYNKRCSYDISYGLAKCYCYGPPKCSPVTFTCDHNCWHNDWRHRDSRARAAGQWNRRCSYEYYWGGRCYCYGSPRC